MELCLAVMELKKSIIQYTVGSIYIIVESKCMTTRLRHDEQSCIAALHATFSHLGNLHQ